MAKDWRKSIEINTHSEMSLTMSGGMSFEV